MASHSQTDPGSAVSLVCCSCLLTDWHQSVSETHHLWGSYHLKIKPSLDWIMILFHFHVLGNCVFLFMWHRDIRELINHCFLAISGCECVYQCIDRSASICCSRFQGVCRKCSGGGQDVEEVFGVADLAGRQTLTYPTDKLALLYTPSALSSAFWPGIHHKTLWSDIRQVETESSWKTQTGHAVFLNCHLIE